MTGSLAGLRRLSGHAMSSVVAMWAGAVRLTSGGLASAARWLHASASALRAGSAQALRAVMSPIRELARAARMVGSRIVEFARRAVRAPAVWVAVSVAVLLVATVLLVPRLRAPDRALRTVEGVSPAPPAATGSTTASPSAAPQEQTLVPEVFGLTAFEARDELLGAELVLARTIPVTGRPGIVVRSNPGVGERVAPGTPVSLFVGAPRERVREES